MTATFIVGRTDLRRTGWQEQPAAPLTAGRGPAAHRPLRPDLEQHHLRRVRRGHELLELLSDRRTPARGCIPVWGFATVIESRCEGVAVGERFYGYYPIADEVVLHPVAVDAQRFIDGAPHRRELHGIYNQYLRCSSDPLYRPRRRGRARPLPAVVHDLVPDRRLSRRQRLLRRRASVLVSSASSKTAYGLGFCLARATRPPVAACRASA